MPGRGGSEHGPPRLLVLRHGKSAWPADVPDGDRPLAPRGRRNAAEVGDRLCALGLLPDLVLCSPARRTRETWELVAARWAAAPATEYDGRLYGAQAGELADVLRAVPAAAHTVLLVGHQPAVQELTSVLAGSAVGDSLERVREKFPTCALAVLELDAPWARLAPGAALLRDFTVPRHHRG
ncbi:histidine phosphatase family protein [Kitasatospora sp. NPDC056138]|uniref:SixA phosphatase family protein n=1 Tax=Kitasatospora sp. NPDC056138 TaxID=3345724 RepID=UPI0035D5DC32